MSDLKEVKKTDFEGVLVSVIVPVFNVERYVDQCVRSILAQTHLNIEVILINDGSTDSSLEICENYRGDRRVIIIDNSNIGLGKTRQLGIDMCRGEYFCTIDSDDWIEPDYIEKLLKCIILEDSDIAVCARKDYRDRATKEVMLPSDARKVVVTKEIVNHDFVRLRKWFVLSDSWNKLYRTSFVRNSGVRFVLDNRYNGTDLLFNHMLILHCPVLSVVNEPLLVHRIVANSRAHRKNKPLYEGFDIIWMAFSEEAVKVGYDDRIKDTMVLLYAIFQEIVTRDIYEESETRTERNARLKKYCQEKRRSDSYRLLCMTKRTISDFYVRRVARNAESVNYYKYVISADLYATIAKAIRMCKIARLKLKGL